MRSRFQSLGPLLLLILSPLTVAGDEASARAGLVGVWRGYVVEGKGEKPDQGPVQVELTITSNTIKGVQFQGERTMDHGTGTYTLNQTNRPAWLDATKPRGNNSQDSWVGIYTLDSDTLKWCVRKKERPTELATKDRAFLLILKRQSSSSAAPVAPSPPVR